MRYGRVLLGAMAILAVAAAGLPARAEAPAKTVRMIPQADLRVLDPIWTTAYITRNHAYMVYDTLFGLDEHFEPKPQMVDTWTVSDDKRRYSFTLRSGLKFHDGQPVRPADCIASLQRWMKRDVLGQKLAPLVVAMNPVDDKTFTIELKAPFPLLISGLAKISGNPFIMPERIAKTDANTQVTDATGSGPFKFVKEEFEPGHKVVYVKNPDYVPRQEPPSWTAGGKVVKVDRVEWIYIPDAATAASALQAGEVDWWQQVPTDLVPVLKGQKGITVAPGDPIGFIGVLGLNHLQPPFDNEKIRQALLSVIDQREYMEGVAGAQEYWRTCFSVYACGTPLASEDGAEALKGKHDIAAAQAMIKEAGYKGERVVVLDATDYAAAHIEALITADLLKKLGLNVDLQASDWGTVLNRRSKKSGVDEGGWSIFHTSFAGPDVVDPSVHQGLRADGEKAWFGWPTDPTLETLRQRWIETDDEAARKRLAAEIQVEAFKTVPYIPLGQFQIPTAFRDTLSGVILAPAVVMWGLEKK